MQEKCENICNYLYTDYMAVGRPANKPRTEFGEKLYQARVEKGLSQMDMAELVNISQQSYAVWERKPTALKPEQLIIISLNLNVSIDSLLGLNPKNNRKGGPVGKLQLLLEEANKLPRSQQNRIFEFVEPFIRQHSAS
jgi:transcriptional regulator with XRE-family HTH domain